MQSQLDFPRTTVECNNLRSPLQFMMHYSNFVFILFSGLCFGCCLQFARWSVKTSWSLCKNFFTRRGEVSCENSSFHELHQVFILTFLTFSINFIFCMIQKLFKGNFELWHDEKPFEGTSFNEVSPSTNFSLLKLPVKNFLLFFVWLCKKFSLRK